VGGGRAADDPIGRWIARLCRLFAVLSGLVLITMALMSFASIVGRAVFGRPILGDYELVQMMSAIAVSLALPYAHWAGAHVIVDFVTARAGPLLRLTLDSLAGLLMAIAASVISLRIAVGMIDLRASQDASMLLGLPTWWAYVPMMLSFALLSLTALHLLIVRIRRGLS
jgi:TRAP-type C4-dicarboxylate transport system permease small subunit